MVLHPAHLDHGGFDDPAHILPPLRHVRVVLVQVGREGEEMRFEVFYRDSENSVSFKDAETLYFSMS